MLNDGQARIGGNYSIQGKRNDTNLMITISKLAANTIFRVLFLMTYFQY